MAVIGQGAADEGQEAGIAFVGFLRACGLPEILWDGVLNKISHGDLGSNDKIEVHLHLQP